MQVGGRVEPVWWYRAIIRGLLHAVATVYYYSCASLRVPQLQPTERALPAQPVLAQPVLAEHYGLPTRARLRLVWVIPSLT